MGADSAQSERTVTVRSIITGNVLYRYSDTRDGTIVDYNKMYLKPYIVLASSLGRGSLARSGNVNLRRDGGESLTSTDTDSLRLTDHVARISDSYA